MSDPAGAVNFTLTAARGRAVVAARNLQSGERLLVEAPMVSMAIPESRSAIVSCELCCRAVGSLTTQLCHLTQLETLPSLPVEDDVLAGDVPCRLGCSARYCCSECEEHAASGHRFLCPARSSSAKQAVEAFEQHALQTYETFLFGARIVADVLADDDDGARYGLLCRAPWWDISDDGVIKSKSERAHARREAERSRVLLLQVLGDEGADAISWLTIDYWGGLLGAARRNNICVQLSHPVAELVDALRELRRSQSHESVDELLAALPNPIPDAIWSALYAKVSCINHSCTPNAEVHFLGEDHEATVITTRRISQGEEVFISYIGHNERAPYQDRRASLRDYGFECDCKKCSQEESWHRRLRPRFG